MTEPADISEGGSDDAADDLGDEVTRLSDDNLAWRVSDMMSGSVEERRERERLDDRNHHEEPPAQLEG